MPVPPEGVRGYRTGRRGDVAAGGLRRVRLHDLRHGAASLVLAGGADIAVVSTCMGHSSVRLTVDTCSHLLEGVGRSTAGPAEGMMRPRAAATAPDAPT